MNNICKVCAEARELVKVGVKVKVLSRVAAEAWAALPKDKEGAEAAELVKAWVGNVFVPNVDIKNPIRGALSVSI